MDGTRENNINSVGVFSTVQCRSCFTIQPLSFLYFLLLLGEIRFSSSKSFTAMNEKSTLCCLYLLFACKYRDSNSAEALWNCEKNIIYAVKSKWIYFSRCLTRFIFDLFRIYSHSVACPPKHCAPATFFLIKFVSARKNKVEINNNRARTGEKSEFS